MVHRIFSAKRHRQASCKLTLCFELSETLHCMHAVFPLQYPKSNGVVLLQRNVGSARVCSRTGFAYIEGTPKATETLS
jgi:hypothetical protein